MKGKRAFKLKKEMIKLIGIIAFWDIAFSPRAAASKYPKFWKELKDAAKKAKELYKADFFDFLSRRFVFIFDRGDKTISSGYCEYSLVPFSDQLNEAYLMYIDLNFWKNLSTVEDKAFVLTHQYAHIRFGHLFRRRVEGLTDKDLNIVADIVVHEYFKPTPHILEELCPCSRESVFLKHGILAKEEQNLYYYADLFARNRKKLPQMKALEQPGLWEDLKNTIEKKKLREK